MITIECIAELKCDLCTTEAKINYFTSPYFNKLEYPVLSIPTGWIIISLWEQGYLRCFCSRCANKVKDKLNEIGVQ